VIAAFLPQMVTDLFLISSATLVGVAAGWLLRAAGSRRAAGREEGRARYARDVLARLRQMAASMAADVGEHTSRVEQLSGELSSGDLHAPEAVVGVVDRLIQANAQMQQQLASADVKLQEQARQIELYTEAARTDALTGLPNRRALDDELAHRLAELERSGKAFSLVILDVDHFKDFNDTYGHLAGDAVLRGLASLARGHLRDDDLPARYGGEEFALVLPGATAKAAAARADAIRRAIEMADFQFGDVALRVTASFGAAEARRGEGAAALVQRADAAMYASKKTGRNCVHFHDGRTTVRFQGQPRPHTPPAAQPQAQSPSAAPPPSSFLDHRDDELGRICDRDAFRTIVGRRLAEWTRGGAPVSVLLLRVDHYQHLLAEHGKPACRAVFRALSQFLHAAIRDMDLLACYDAATFAVLLPQADPVAAAAVAERLGAAIAQCRLPLEHREVAFTVSLGGATATRDDDVPGLMRRADDALEAAVQSGGNCCYYHNGQWSEISSSLLARAKTDAPSP
jgi:diguanylate cyclase